MNKRSLRIAGWAIGLSLAFGAIGTAVGASQTAPIEAEAARSTTVSYSATAGDVFGGTINSVNSTSTGTQSLTDEGETVDFDLVGVCKLVSLKSGKKDYRAFSDPYAQIGSNNANVLLTLTASDIPGTITSVDIDAYGSNHTMTVKVDGTSYHSAALGGAVLENPIHVAPNASGELLVTFSASSAKALYFASISVTYSEESSTFAVTYHDTGKTSGSAPTDGTDYGPDEKATVLGQGTLAKTGYVFSGWNTQEDGEGTGYEEGNEITMTDDVDLYPVWTADTVDRLAISGSMSQTAYTEGDNWDPAGFTINAYYDSDKSTPVDVTSDPELRWSYSPAKANDTSVTSVIATATYRDESISSVAQTVKVNESTDVKYTLPDQLTTETFGSPASYTSWSGKTATSSAVYAGQSTTNSAGSIQIRTSSNSGIVSTSSGGKAKKVTVLWDSASTGKTIDIYGKNTAYSGISDLYDESKKGTKIGSIVYDTSSELVISGDYEYIGLRSKDGAAYLQNVVIAWGVSVAKTATEVTAANGFIAAYMHLDRTKSEGSCKSTGDGGANWYSTAKSEFAKISQKAKLIIATSASKYAKIDLDPEHKDVLDPESVTYTYADVKDRLVKWAHFAASENISFDDVTGSIQAARVVSQGLKGSTSIGVPLAISVVAVGLAAAGGLLFLHHRHRKED